MAKKREGTHKGPQKPKPKAAKSIREQIKGAFAHAGIDVTEVNDFGAQAESLGDGQFLKRLLKLAELLGPLLKPFLGLSDEKNAASEAPSEEDAATVEQLKNLAAQCGLTDHETVATAKAGGLFAVAEKWLSFGLAILPFLKDVLNDTTAASDEEDTGGEA